MTPVSGVEQNQFAISTLMIGLSNVASSLVLAADADFLSILALYRIQSSPLRQC